MPDTERMITVAQQCSGCGKSFDVDCRVVGGFGHLPFYRLDCPSCGKVNHVPLPGDPLDVRARVEHR